MSTSLDSHIILFDGVCNLCNGFVQFVIKRDKKARFQFASLQSPVAEKLLKSYHLSNKTMESVILIHKNKNKIWTESSAVLNILRNLNGLYPFLYGFIIIPKGIRDFFYRQISKNRYKWFGKRDACMIPSPEIKKRFLE